MNVSTFIHRLILCATIFLFLGAGNLVLGQQLTITSPKPGTVYSPGQNIDVAVTVSNGQVIAVMVGAQDVAFTNYQTAGPYLFSLTAPANKVGPKNLFAMGLVGSENVTISPIITIDVEPPSVPTGISFQQKLVTFAYQGQQRKVGVTAVFADGTTLDISRSSRIKFSTDSPTVVTVDQTGLMTANGVGSANVTVSYDEVTSTLKAIGPNGVVGDFNGDGVVDSDDLFLLESMVGTSPTGPSDARDLNKDGKIDEVDVQILLTLCGVSCPALTSTATSLTSSMDRIQFPAPLTLTALVSGSASPSGNVNFLVDGRPAGFAGLNSRNIGTFVINSLAVGDHVIVASYPGDSNNAASTSPTLSTQVFASLVVGDLNGDGVVNCADIGIVKASFGKRTGQQGFDPRADVNGDGVVNTLDLSFVTSQLLAGTVCADVTPPNTSFASTPPPNSAGWNNADVTVILSSIDNPGGSGVKQIAYSATGAQTIASTVVNGSSTSFAISMEGLTTIAFFGTDNAGNVELAKTLTIKLDKTPPTITPVRMPLPNPNGWNNSNVTVSFQCADNLSGLAAGSPPAPTLLSAEGAGQSVSGSCTDIAGNSVSSPVSGVNIDKTSPVITASANPATLWPPNGKMVPVTISGTIADNLSGVNPSTASFGVKDSYGLVQPTGPVSVAANGAYSFTISLEARRDGQDNNGRLYTIVVSGQDNAGNASSATTTATVPHDQGK
jgi:uncharacterized protein (DUF2141 family)